MTWDPAEDHEVLGFPESKITEGQHKGNVVISLPVAMKETMAISTSETNTAIPVENMTTHLTGIGADEVLIYAELRTESLTFIDFSVR